MENETENKSFVALGVSYVNSLLSRHNVPDRERAKLVQKILNLKYHPALRRVNGTIPWTIEELHALASYFQESLADVAMAVNLKDSQPANLIIEGTKLSCVVRIEKELDQSADISPSFIAVKEDGDGWNIYQSSRAPTNKPLFGVSSISLDLHQTGSKPVIAVVDDDEELAETLSLYLNQQSLIAIPYYTLHDFRMARKKIAFSAYVLDWRMGKNTVEEDIRNIRQVQEEIKTPIIILTGTLSAGEANASDIAYVVREFDAVLLQKPAYLQILHAELSKMLSKVKNASNATDFHHNISPQ